MRVAKPVDRPSHHHIEFAPAGIPQHCIESRALVAALGPADAGVVVRLDDQPATTLCDRLQGFQLVFYSLLVG
jgi:hypothetical protein